MDWYKKCHFRKFSQAGTKKYNRGPKVDWYKKYNIESKEKDWVFPKTDQEKAFALELIIDHLYNN